MPAVVERIIFDGRLSGVRTARSGAAALDPCAAKAEYERGLKDGEARAREALARDWEEIKQLKHGVLARMETAWTKALRESESGLISLALEIARRIVGGIEISSETVAAVVREALNDVEGDSAAQVELNPEDLALLQRAEPGWLTASEAAGRLTLRASAEVTRGGCIVRTKFGILDARRETKLEIVRQTLQAN